ncbi:MAG: lysylphosphatidylglycerol synthase transmembrane domain-containing protein [Myxococcota bacterium]
MRHLKRLVTLGLLGAIAYLIATREGMDTIHAHLADLRFEWMLVAALFAILAVSASVRRWQLLLSHEGIALPFATLFASFLRGRFVGAFTPSTTGLDLYRLVDIGRRATNKAASGRAVLTEKLYGLVALALVTAALLPAGIARFFGSLGVLAAIGIGVVAILGLAALARPAFLRRVCARLPKALRQRAHRMVDLLTSRAMTKERTARVIAFGLLSHSATAAIFVATGVALGLEVSPLALLVVGNAIILATLLPISVGGVGVRETTAVVLLSTVGVGTTEAALVGLLGYLAMQPPALVGGLLLLRGAPSLAEPHPAT